MHHYRVLGGLVIRGSTVHHSAEAHESNQAPGGLLLLPLPLIILMTTWELGWTATRASVEALVQLQHFITPLIKLKTPVIELARPAEVVPKQQDALDKR